MKQLPKLCGPVLLEIKVKIDSRENLGRPTTTPIENKEHFMDFLKINIFDENRKKNIIKSWACHYY